MAVTECPNCSHDIQTPGFSFFGKKEWAGFTCPYCRAQLERRKTGWHGYAYPLLSLLAVVGLPTWILKGAHTFVFFLPILIALLYLSRPKLQVVKAPHDPARELSLRQSQQLPPQAPQPFPGQKPKSTRLDSF